MNVTFAAWLAEELRRRGVDGVADAARAVGVSQSMMSNYLNGKQAPGRKSIKKIAAWAGVPEGEILTLLPDGPFQGYGHSLLTGDPGSGIQNAAVTAQVAFRSPKTAALFFGVVGELDEEGPDLTEEEAASVYALVRRIRDRRRADRGGSGAEGGFAGAGGPR